MLQGVFRWLMGIFLEFINPQSAELSAVSKAIASLKAQYIHFEPKRETTAGFYDRAGFPGVIGAIDCTHITITNPGGENGELFRNRSS